MARAYRLGSIALAMWIFAVPAATFAQQTNAGITGIARDASDAVNGIAGAERTIVRMTSGGVYRRRAG